MKVVILCGGLGTRLKEETEFKPKPLVDIGGKPILWHIMKLYSHYGFNEFILCLGYKGQMIRDYFLKYKSMANDFTLDLNNNKGAYHSKSAEDWKITFAETGAETNTGGRLKKIEKYIKDDNFFVTYGDGLADVNISSLLKYHLEKGKIATLTSIQPTSVFGVVEFDQNGLVKSFKEKPKLDGWISGGFFVFNKKIFSYLDENSILEVEPLMKLAKENNLVAYPHIGFWKSMDTYKDHTVLNNIWNCGNPPWRTWNE